MNDPLVILKDFRISTVENNSIRVSCLLRDQDDEETELWFEISGVPKNYSVDVADAFVAPGLLFALKRNSGVRFEVPISESLAEQVHDIAFIFGTQRGFDTRPQIEVLETVTVERKARGGVTGFSGGVDSWFSLKKNFLECQDSSKKLTHLLVNDVGANTTRKKVKQVTESAKNVASVYGLGLVRVTSNMSSVLQMNFQQTHTARNASVALLLSSICDIFYYSSADTYAHAGVFPTYDMAYADTILLPLLSNDSINLRSSGSSFSRAEKTREILDIQQIGELLDVCVRHNHSGSKINCGGCWKCLRTELTLEAFGVLPQFSSVFDLKAYQQNRSRYVKEISLSRKPVEREVFDLIIEAGLDGPKLLLQVQGAGIKLARRAKRSLTAFSSAERSK